MQRCVATDSRRIARQFGVVRSLIRRIVDGVADGQKYHLKLSFPTTALTTARVSVILISRSSSGIG